MADVGDDFAARLHSWKPISAYAKRGYGEDAWLRQCSGMHPEGGN
jgi:hypothetical protein